jgi:hypothetical protein
MIAYNPIAVEPRPTAPPVLGAAQCHLVERCIIEAPVSGKPETGARRVRSLTASLSVVTAIGRSVPAWI